MTDLSLIPPKTLAPSAERAMPKVQYLTVAIAGQALGIPVLLVHDVLGQQRITRVPLAPDAILGSLNLRGRIVTAIDVRRRLGLGDRSGETPGMCVVVEYGAELYSLAVDSVGEVLGLGAGDVTASPVTMDQVWRDVSKGIHRMEEQLLIVLDVDRLIAGTFDQPSTQRSNWQAAA